MRVLFHKYKDILFLLFLSILVPLLWYGFDPNMMITSQDVGSSIDPVVLFEKRIFAWNSSINLGISQTSQAGSIFYYGIEALAAYVTGSVFIGQKIIIILWFFFTMLVMYICLQKLPVFNNMPYMALFASLLFQFNHFQQHGWRVFWRARFATYMLLPILLILLIDYLEGRRNLIKTAIYAGISVLILNAGGSPPIFGAVILLVLVTIIYYLLINFRGNFLLYLKRSVYFILVSGVVAIAISSFWLLPYAYFAFSTYSQSLESLGGISSQLGWVDQISANAGILNLFRNVGLPFWNPSSGDPHLFFANPVLIVISFIWPILTISSLFFVNNKEQRKYITLLLSLTIVALIFTTGTHKPFREFYIFLLNHIPGYVIFRSPLYKFGNLLWFSYAVLIAFSMSAIIIRIKDILAVKKRLTKIIAIILPAFFITFIFLWDFPILNNKFFVWSPPLTIMEQIPQYVIDFKDWVNKSEDMYGRIVLLPDSNRTWRHEVYRWKYFSFGSQLLPLSTNKNTLANDATTSGFERLYLDRLYDLLRKNDPAWLDMAHMLNIRYFLLRRDFFYDIDWLQNTQPYVYEEILVKDNNVEKIKTFGQWDIYRIKTDSAADKISAKIKPIFYSTSDNNLPSLFSLASQLEKDSLHKSIFIHSKDSSEEMKNNTLIIMPEPMAVYLPTDTGKFELPQPKLLPNSPLYFLTQLKEKDLLRKGKTPEQINNIYLKLSQNRLAELNELLILEENGRVIDSISDMYISLLNAMKNNLDNLIKTDNDNSKIKVQTKGLLMEESKFFKGWIQQQKTGKIKEILEKDYQTLEDLIGIISIPKEQEAVLSGMMAPFNDPDIVFLTEYYKWKIPQSGLYKIYLNKNSLLLNSKSIKITVGEKSTEAKTTGDKESGQYVGDIELVEGEQGLQIETDGIKLSSIRQSDLVFIKENTDSRRQSVPEISYSRVNPTKFVAKISARSPFFLLLDEKFDPEWRIYIKDKFSSKSLIDKHILNTLFLHQEENVPHLEVNGYANAWFIDPAKYVQKEDFEIVLEYWPQRIFYLSFIITILVSTGSIIYFWKSRTTFKNS